MSIGLRRLWRRLGGGSSGALLAAALSISGCSNRLLLYPTHDPISPNATPCGDGERFEIPATRRPIAGRTIEVFCARVGLAEREPAVTVLAFGGNGGRAELTVGDLRRFFDWASLPFAGPGDDAPHGVEILAVQYPGFGADDDPATLRGLAAGALDAWDWARARSGDRPIVVYGLSMGSTAALHVARGQLEADAVGPDGLILDRPPHIPGIILGRHGWWNLWLVAGPVAASLPRSVYSRANAKAITDTPALFLLASNDELARPRNAGKIVAAYGGRKLTAWFPGRHNAVVSAGYRTIGHGLCWLWAELGLACRG